MTRSLLIDFDPAGAAAELPWPAAANLLQSGPLRVAYSGPPAADGDLLCLFAGRLDNGAELAAALGAGSEPGDSVERLLADGYQRWGLGLPARLRGDFVLLVWDRRRQEGLVARDQLGARPGYLWRSGRQLRCATELPTLLATLPRRPAPDQASVAHWITAGSRPGKATLYSGVERLGPGELIALGEELRTVRYWQPRYEEPLVGNEEELAEQVRGGLEMAVGRRLAAPGSTAVLLSGGLDSAAVAAVAAELDGDSLLACSATFPDHPDTDETALIADLRAELGLGGPLLEVRASGLLDSAAAHVRAHGVPLLSWGDFWILPLLRGAAAEGATAVLGGDGGDELFGPRQNLVAAELRRGRPRAALATVARLPGAGPRVPRRAVASLLAEQTLVALPAAPHRRVERWRQARSRPGWLRPSAAVALRESADPLAWKRLDGPLWWAELAHGMGSGLDECGIFEHQHQRATLAGLAARHPLLDLDLVELGLRQPPAATLDPRFSRPLLRRALAGRVPDQIRLRPAKARFDALVIDCLARSEAAAVRSLLADPGAQLAAYVDTAAAGRELLDGKGALEFGSFAWMWLVWRLVTAEIWLRQEAAGGSGSTTFSPLDRPISKAEHSPTDG
ncbi:MAG: asparagine synthase-related protein [Solirubrobacterales bacterium]